MTCKPAAVIGTALQQQFAASHEHTLVGPTGGSGWIQRPVSTQLDGTRGADPRYSSLASTGWGRRNDADVIAWGAWTHLTPWFVSVRGASNAYAPADTATNTCIEILEMSAQVRRESSKEWVFTHARGPYAWVDAYNFQTTGGASGTIQTPRPGCFLQDVNSSAHGGLGRGPLPLLNGEPDIDAMLVSCTARLALINEAGTDDRANSNLVLVVGADFYPNGTATAPQIQGVSGWIPGCGYGRFQWVRQQPRKFQLIVRKPGVTDASLLAAPPLPV